MLKLINILFAFVVTALVLVLFFYDKIRGKLGINIGSSKFHTKNNDGKNPKESKVENDYNNLECRIKTLEDSVQQLQKDFRLYSNKQENAMLSIREEMKSIQEEITGISRDSKLKEKEIMPVATSPLDINVYPYVKYAFSPDVSSPSGFSIGAISEFADNCCYEITFKSADSATFRFIEDENKKNASIQAMSTVIDPCCTYDVNRPITQRFETIKEGELKLINSIWEIIVKSEITFI